MCFIRGNFLLFSLSVVLFSPLMFSLADEFCKKKDACRCVMQNNSVIDLTPVGRLDGPRFPFISVLDAENHTFLLSYNPCYNFTQHINTLKDELPCENVAACKLVIPEKPGVSAEVGAVGFQNTAQFSGANLADMEISYSAKLKPEFDLKIQLKCNWGLENPEFSSMGIDKNNVTTLMMLETKCACPDACSSADPSPVEKKGLSTGSGLLIAFFTIAIVYFVLGITWNFCNGAQGSEVVPNVKFWGELPQLIVDGFLFTCSCCTRRSQSSYSDM